MMLHTWVQRVTADDESVGHLMGLAIGPIYYHDNKFTKE